MNFLAAHECTVDYRQFRSPGAIHARPLSAVGCRSTARNRATRINGNPEAALDVSDSLFSARHRIRAAGCFATRAISASSRSASRPRSTAQTRNRGLLGRSSLAAGYALILAPCSSIHTFFMQFAIDVVFVDRDGLVLRARPAVRPWRIAGSPSARLPLSSSHEGVLAAIRHSGWRSAASSPPNSTPHGDQVLVLTRLRTRLCEALYARNSSLRACLHRFRRLGTAVARTHTVSLF